MDEIEAGDTDGLDDEDPERVGGTFPHTFILEVIQDAENEPSKSTSSRITLGPVVIRRTENPRCFCESSASRYPAP